MKTCRHCKNRFDPSSDGYKKHLCGFCSCKCKNRFYDPWVEYECVVCSEVFQKRKRSKDASVKGVKKTCSKECGYILSRSHTSKSDERAMDVKNKNIHFKENDFSKQKYKYQDKIIEYKDSPTNGCYIGFAKEPLMESSTGIGFQGVKVQSENRELIQCFECGKWYQTLSHTHMQIRHGMSLAEYKEKHGFNKNTALVSDVYGNFLAEKMTKCINKAGKRLPQRKLNKMLKGTRGKNNRNTLEMQNNRGTCPEQLKAALVNYINRFRRIPHSTSGRDGLPCLNTIKSRAGTLNKYLISLGLPARRRIGGASEYIFPDGTRMFSKDPHDYEIIYQTMVRKCPVLTSIK